MMNLVTDRINVTGADWVYENGVAIIMADVTDSATKDTGALVVEGGVGIEKSVNIGGNIRCNRCINIHRYWNNY